MNEIMVEHFKKWHELVPEVEMDDRQVELIVDGIINELSVAQCDRWSRYTLSSLVRSTNDDDKKSAVIDFINQSENQ